MRAALASTVVLLMAIQGCGSPAVEPGPDASAKPLRSAVADTTSVQTALGASAFVPNLETLQASSCDAQVAALVRSLRAFELLYEGSPLALRGGTEETIPKAPNPPGEEFRAFEDGFLVGLSADGTQSPTTVPEGTTAVLLSADRHAPGDVVRDTLVALRDAGVERVGLVFARPLDIPPVSGPDVAHGTPNAALVFDESCPVDWTSVQGTAPAERAEVWIDRVSEAVVRCNCDVDLEHVLWLQRQEYDASRPIAIPIDPRGTPGDRPLVIREGGPWGPAARALFDAIRIDPVRPHGTPVVIDVVSKGRSGIVPNLRGSAGVVPRRKATSEPSDPP